MGVRREEHRLGNSCKQMKKHKDKPTRINLCWQIGDEKKMRDPAKGTRI